MRRIIRAGRLHRHRRPRDVRTEGLARAALSPALWCTIGPPELPMNTRFVLATLGVAALCALVLVPLAAQSTPTRTFAPLTDIELTPEIKRPAAGNSILVFA